MLHRMALIQEVGGTGPYLRTWLLLLASIAMPIFELVYFGGVIGGFAVAVLTILGWYFRGSIMELGAVYGKSATLILFVYGVALFVAKYSGVGIQGQLVVIIIATSIMFNLNFWSISEAALVEKTFPGDDDPVVDLADSAVEAFRHNLAEALDSYIRLSVSGGRSAIEALGGLL